MTKRPLQFFLGCLLWLTATCVYAETPIAVVNNLDEPFDLNPFVETIEDPQHQYTLEDIQTGKYDRLWVRNQERYFIGRDNKSKYWWRVTLKWNSEQILNGVLYIKNQPVLIQHLTVILPKINENGINRISVGGLEPYHNRLLDSNQYSFPVSSSTGEYQTLVGWLDSSEIMLPSLLPLYLISEKKFEQLNNRNLGTLIAFYSVMAALLLYNSCLFMTLRLPVYGYYLLFLICVVLACAFNDGSASHWIFPQNPRLLLQTNIASGIVLSMTYTAFLLNALDSLPRWPKYKKICRLFLRGGSIGLLMTAISGNITLSFIFNQIYISVSILTALFLIGSAVIKHIPTSGYLFIAETFTVIGGTAYMLMFNGIVPINDFTFWGLHWGSLGETLLLSLALASRTRIAQQSAIENLKKYEALYTDSFEGLFNYDVTTTELKCNRAFANLFGFADVNEMPLSNSPLAQFNDSVQIELHKILNKSGFITHYETQMLSPKLDNPIWVSINMRLIKDEKGKAIHTEGSMVDISERKLKEQAELDRTTADYKNAAKSQFFASMSHELRTPLTAILGYSETAIPQDVSTQQKQNALEIIHRSGNHLLQIINDILDLSKVEAQKLDVEQIQVYLLPLLDEVQDTLKVLAQQKNLSFTLNHHYPLPKIFTNDPTRIKQVLLNLCGNAIKFTETGGVSIDVMCDKEQQLLSFNIKDTGIGLKPEQVNNLFEAFTQADASTTRNYGGTGLGLHLSKQLAQKLGGDIKVTSVYGTGSTFTFTVATANLNNSEWLDGSLQTITVPKLSGSVLYAEDNLDNQNLVKAIVEKTGATITLVSNGKEALEICTQQTFDLVFTDIRMPIIDGVELTKALLEKYTTLPVVAISATLIDKEIEEFRAVGFKEMLRKPVERKAIYAVLTEYLNPSSPVSKTTDLTIPHPTSKPLRVLLAEDNLDNQGLIKIHLKRAGAEAIIANDGIDAIAAAMRDDVDMILMDMQMPNMDGLTAVRYLRGKGFDKPIYALTANETAESIKECKDAGCEGHLSKPLDTAKLSELIRHITG